MWIHSAEAPSLCKKKKKCLYQYSFLCVKEYFEELPLETPSKGRGEGCRDAGSGGLCNVWTGSDRAGAGGSRIGETVSTEVWARKTANVGRFNAAAGVADNDRDDDEEEATTGGCGRCC